MAKKYDNDKGFLIIQMDCLEATIDCGFGIKVGTLAKRLLCDNCNNVPDPFDDVFYFAVLNRLMCRECCEDIVKNLDRNSEDIEYEKAHYNYYAKKLNLEEI